MSSTTQAADVPLYMRLYSIPKLVLVIASAMSILAGFSACDTPEPYPAYLHIDNFDLETLAGEGSSSHNVTHVWAFVNGASVGTYELPTTIPVLADGDSEVFLQAGVNSNGFSEVRTIYPFYSFDTYNVSFSPLDTTILQPTLSYQSQAVFSFINDFEVSNNLTPVVGSNGISLISDDELVFEGSRSGLIQLDGAANSFELHTVDIYPLPNGTTNASYLELNYRCDIPFDVLVIGVDNFGLQIVQPILTINTKTTWNKLYVELTDDVAIFSENDIDLFKIGFRAALPADTEVGQIYFDNIKLVHN